MIFRAPPPHFFFLFSPSIRRKTSVMGRGAKPPCPCLGAGPSGFPAPRHGQGGFAPLPISPVFLRKETENRKKKWGNLKIWTLPWAPLHTISPIFPLSPFHPLSTLFPSPLPPHISFPHIPTFPSLDFDLDLDLAGGCSRSMSKTWFSYDLRCFAFLFLLLEGLLVHDAPHIDFHIG